MADRETPADLELALTPESFDLSKSQVTFRLAMADAPAALWLPMLVQDIPAGSARHECAHDAADDARSASHSVAWSYRPDHRFFPRCREPDGNRAEYADPHERLYTGQYVCVMRKDHPLASQALTIDTYCEANHLLVSFSGRAHGQVNDVLTQLGRERRILFTVNQFYTAGSVVASSDLITVLPRHLVASTGRSDELIAKELPFEMPPVHVDMLWHERDARNPAHRWLRAKLSEATDNAMGSGILKL